MSKTNNIIKLNGKHFDATTGRVLNVAAPATSTASKAKVAHPRHPASHATAHSPEHAKTLMRHSVKKPASQPTKQSAAPVMTVAQKALERRVNAARLQHAKQIRQSKLISHFTPSALVMPEPAASTPKPVMDESATRPAATGSRQATTELLQRALEQATAHEQPAHKARRRGTTKHRGLTMAMVAAVLAVVGLFASQNVSGWRVQMASSKAGFSAALPSYHPAGFRLGELNANTGVVAFNYISNSDQDRQIAVTEKSSTWSNQQLLTDFVQVNSQQHQTIYDNGQTYYLYDGHSITWVSGGIWYQVHSQDALGQQQLLKLANSL